MNFSQRSGKRIRLFQGTVILSLAGRAQYGQFNLALMRRGKAHVGAKDLQ